MSKKNLLDSAPSARGEGVAAVYMSPRDIRPNAKNIKVHGDNIARLARIILRTTWGAPILVQRSTRRIIGGHGRREAALAILAGLEVDGIMRGGAEHCFDRDAPGPGLVPVRLLDVSDAEADAMTLADNAKGLQGEDDAASIVAMATACFERDAPVMRDMGLSAAELDALVKAAGDAVLAAAPSSSSSPPAAGDVVTDLESEWQGMPEFEQKDKTAFRSLVVHFNDQEAVDAFAQLVGQKLTDRTRFLWYPEIVIERYADKAYTSGEGSSGE